MLISCVLRADEVPNVLSSIVVFPAGIHVAEMELAASKHPDAIVVGAIAENGMCRGVLLHRGRNRIDYLKISTNDGAKGSNDIRQSAVYETEETCVGVLICTDVNNFGFSRMVVGKVKASNAPLKVICIPADMGPRWYSSGIVEPAFDGLHIALCNHAINHESRLKSFITDTRRQIIRRQRVRESIHATIK